MDRGAWQATYSPLGCKESDMTEPPTLSLSFTLNIRHFGSHPPVFLKQVKYKLIRM